MVFIQRNDERKFIQKPFFKGNGIKTSKKPHSIYLQSSEGDGFLDTISSIANVVSENKDLISQGVNTVKNIVDVGKSISDTIKLSKELETIQARKNKKKQKNEEEYKLTPEQEEKLKSLGFHSGNGFAKF